MPVENYMYSVLTPFKVEGVAFSQTDNYSVLTPFEVEGVA